MGSSNKAKILLSALGYAVSVAPVSICILLYFPLWREKGAGAIVSGLALILLLLGAVPLFKGVMRMVKSPSAPIMWFAIFVLFFMLSKIADEITVISFVGFISNLCGAFLFRLGGRRKNGGKSDETD